MPLLRATSIKRKLTAVVMLTTTVALLATAVQFILNDARDYRRRVLADLEILARVLGQNFASSLEFEDTKMAGQILAALQAKPHVLAAAVYNKDGKIFAYYPNQSLAAQTLPSVPPVEGH